MIERVIASVSSPDSSPVDVAHCDSSAAFDGMDCGRQALKILDDVVNDVFATLLVLSLFVRNAQWPRDLRRELMACNWRSARSRS